MCIRDRRIPLRHRRKRHRKLHHRSRNPRLAPIHPHRQRTSLHNQLRPEKPLTKRLRTTPHRHRNHQESGKPYHPQTQGKVESFHQALKIALAHKPPATSIDELNSQLDDIIDYYNHKRPHRALDRITPAEADNALPKATPNPAHNSHDFRLRTDKVGTNGKTTLRWRGKLRRLYIGRRWGGEPITMICVDNHVDIKLITTGAQIAAYTRTDEKIYYNQKDIEITPPRGTPKTKNLETP